MKGLEYLCDIVETDALRISSNGVSISRMKVNRLAYAQCRSVVDIAYLIKQI
jgi:hypothetical protein